MNNLSHLDKKKETETFWKIKRCSNNGVVKGVDTRAGTIETDEWGRMVE